MSDQTTYEEPGGDEVLAAEYVLGVIDADARRTLERRLADDRGFALLVARWQADLAPFNAAYAEATPPALAFAAIEERLFGKAAPDGLLARLWRGAGFWRALAFAAIGALAVGVVLVLNAPRPAGPDLVTSIAANQSDVSFVALYDRGRDRLTLRRTSGGDAAGGRSYELWVIPEGQDPVSLGVLAGARAERALGGDLAGLIVVGATLAVTLEPEGGSPSGAPTGPVIAAGPVESL